MRPIIVPIVSTLALVLALAATPEARANCDNPQCTPNVDGSGCCRSNCTWKASGAGCRDEEDPCHKGTCQANGQGGLACVQPSGGGSNASNGAKCVVPENPCLIGACHSGNCTGIGGAASGEFSDRCPDIDHNPCTDHCNAFGTTFISCDTHNAPNGIPCYATSGTTCRNGGCVNGSCDTTGGTTSSCPSLPVCSKYVCDPYQGCQVRPDPSAICDDTSPTDCKEKFCVDPYNDGVGNGRCRTINLDAGEPCAPGDGNACTFDECNATGSCNVVIPVPDNPVTDCTNTASPPTTCQLDQCVGGACTNVTNPAAVGQPCQTDTNTCTNQACAANGACATVSCNDGAPCVLCGTNGICAPGCGCQTQ